MTEKIYPCLWFDGQAEEAANFYCSIFKNSGISSIQPPVVNFEINGQKIMALDGGPHFKFNESVSFVINCKDQEEIDYYWSKLVEGGTEQQCGWLKDKYGLSWQIVPAILGKLMADQERAPRVAEAFLKMVKFDIEKLMNA